MAWSSHIRICIITSIKCSQTNQTKPNATRARVQMSQSKVLKIQKRTPSVLTGRDSPKYQTLPKKGAPTRTALDDTYPHAPSRRARAPGSPRVRTARIDTTLLLVC